MSAATVGGLEQILREDQVLRPRRSARSRLLTVARDNPLGTFGLMVIIALLITGTFGPGLTIKMPITDTTVLSTPRLTPHAFNEIGAGPANADPSLAHPFGTDKSGRDMLARVVAGARISLLVGFISVLGGIAVGMVIGIASGYFGGLVDSSIQRSVDTIIAFPGLVILLILMSILDPSKLTVTVVIGLITVFPTIRIIRGATLSEKNNQYVEAARTIGASSPRIVFRHLMPNVAPLAIVLATTGLGAAILAEAALGFLGLGIPAPNPSWGTDINAARNSFPVHVWWAFFPGAAISLTVLGFNLLGDSIRDIADPRLRGSRG